MAQLVEEIIVVWNAVVFFMYGADKYFAIKNKRRISEKALIFSSFLLGGAGAFFGMNIFRHKTKHKKFKICVPIDFVFTAFALYLIVLK